VVDVGMLLEVVLAAASILSFVLAARAATREFRAALRLASWMAFWALSWSAVRPGGCTVVGMLLLEVVRETGMVADG